MIRAVTSEEGQGCEKQMEANRDAIVMGEEGNPHHGPDPRDVESREV